MSFSEYDVTRRTRKGNYSIEKAIAVYYEPVSDATGRPAYPGLLLFKMLPVGVWNGGSSDESVEDDVSDHSVLSRFRTRLTAAGA